ncbi:TIGR02679 family protein [Bacillaceae bacterium Marseille-Q3522]|nr:TIGR02679 family protein [Bacillaceae bacterium Marseille-Q3522]
MNKKIQIFKEEPGFVKLFKLFKDKYRSLGRIGGNVHLREFTDTELESIAGFLGQSKDKLKQKGSIALLDFEKELANTGFSEYTLLPLLEEVLQEKIYTKKEELEQLRRQEEQFIVSVKQAIPEAARWLQWIQDKKPDTRWIWSLYQQNKTELHEKLVQVFRAFRVLPEKGEFERLPFFSQRTTGNPHYFDHNETAGKLLLHCMYVDQVSHLNPNAAMPKSVEELNDFLGEYGIMRDDLWNFVTCRGLLAAAKNSIHPVWRAAADMQTVMNVPMKELEKLERIWPFSGANVWIVENSSVCSTIMDAVPAAPIICTHGQLRAAGWRMLDLLVQSDCRLFYSGDLDPEGIIIADRLKKRYGDHLILWRMDTQAYKASLSNEAISTRMVKLDNLSSPEWQKLINLMNEVKLAGYQEAIVSSLICDIRKYFT